MKKILLSFVGIACTLLSYSQLIINELYVIPNTGRQEFFELKNTSPAPVNADCYSLVTYFNEGGVTGLYVVNIPAITVAGSSYLVSSSQTPDFYYQDTVAVSDFSWNDGNVNRYVYTGGTLVLDNTGAPFTNIFLKSNGSTHGNNGEYAVFLFEGSTLVDAFLGASITTTVASYITQLGQLTNTGGDACGNLSYNFNNINNEADSLFNNVNQAAGSDNGYARMNATCGNYGTWMKTAMQGDHTPGFENPGNSKNLNGASTLQTTMSCTSNTQVTYNITAGSSIAFPVIVSLYFDANGSQFLDAGDIFIGQKTDAAVSDPSKTFDHPTGQEDFILVFDAKGDCFDTILALNCPAAIILPVSLTSFTAARSANGILLKWTTASETGNKGFNVQKLSGSTWESIGFVNAATAGGNSNSVLNYSFTDVNVATGIVQYRLQQVDIDGKFKYSSVRSVRIEASAAKPVVFPNPARGTTTVLFANSNSVHDVQLTDMNGRMLKQWQNVTDNDLKITGLTPGLYMILVTDRNNGTRSFDKLVVSEK